MSAGPPFGGYGYGAPQPGTVPLRPLALGEILDGAIRTIRRQPAATLGLAGVVVLVQTGLNVALDALLGALPGSAPTTGAGSYVGLAVGEVIGTALSALLLGMLVVIVVDAAAGRPTTVRRAWGRVRHRFWRLFAASLLAGLLPFLGLAGLIVLGVYLWAALAFAPAAVVIEGVGVWESLRRSIRLVRHSWWRVFGIYLLAQVIAAVLGTLVTAPVAVTTTVHSLHGGHGTSHLAITTGGYALSLVLEYIARVLTAPFVAGVVSLLYLDRRMRAEDFDIRQAAVDPAPGH